MEGWMGADLTASSCLYKRRGCAMPLLGDGAILCGFLNQKVIGGWNERVWLCYHAQRVIYSKAGTLFWDDLGSFRWQGGALTHSITHWQWMSVSQSVCVSVCMCVCVLMLVCLCLLSVWLCVFVWMSAVPCEKEPPLDKLCQMTSVNVFHCMSESRWVIKTVDLIFLFSAKKHL